MKALKFDQKTGQIEPALWLASPNYDQRPCGIAIDTIIIHAISLPPRQYGNKYIDDLFCNKLDPTIDPYFAQIYSHKVSAHFLIRRQGELVQFVSAYHRAWHAGKSELAGRFCVNDFSIGIELEGSDEDCFEVVQYETLANLTRLLIQYYRAITFDRVVGHCDIAPGRKTDPGPNFNWRHFKQQIRQ